LCGGLFHKEAQILDDVLHLWTNFLFVIHDLGLESFELLVNFGEEIVVLLQNFEKLSFLTFDFILA